MMDNINILFGQDLEEEPIVSVLNEIWEHPAHDCQALHNFIEKRNEIREDNLEWFRQHPMPNKSVCSVFVHFFNHFPDNDWLDFFWDRYIEGHMEELSQKSYGNMIFYAATEIMNAYSSGVPLEIVRECCRQYGNTPSRLSMAFHRYVCERSNDIEEGEKQEPSSDEEMVGQGMEGRRQEEKDSLTEENKRLMTEITNLNTQISDFLMLISEKDDTIHDLMKQAETMQETLQSKERIICDLQDKQMALNKKLRILEQNADARPNDTAVCHDNSFWGKHTRKAKLRDFRKLSDVSQREAIVRLILDMPGDNDAFPLIKKLLDDKKIGNEFLYTYLLDNPEKGCLNDLLVLFGLTDGLHAHGKVDVEELEAGQDTDNLVRTEESAAKENTESNIVIEDSDEEEDEDAYY